jgi:hypothetical protein
MPRQRNSQVWERDPLDWYVEPEWVSEALFKQEPFEGPIWDPCAGTGRIADAARNAGYTAHATDIDPRGFENVLPWDFVTALASHRFGNIVSNPPFKTALKVVENALVIAERKVAMFMPTNWVQGEKRSAWLETTPLRRVLFVCPRPSCPPGDVLARGEKPGNGNQDFAWYIWERDYVGKPEIGWCRRGKNPRRATEGRNTEAA